jgi:hypothetical protein
MKNSNFRGWVRNIWLENCNERFHYREPEVTIKEYFSRYKWWLKREYRHQTKMDKL